MHHMDDARRRAMFANMANDRDLYKRVSSDINYNRRLDDVSGIDDKFHPMGRDLVVFPRAEDKELGYQDVLGSFERVARPKKTTEDIVLGGFDETKMSRLGRGIGQVKDMSDSLSMEYADIDSRGQASSDDPLLEYAKTISDVPSSDIRIDADKSDVSKGVDEILEYGKTVKQQVAPLGSIKVSDEYAGPVRLVVKNKVNKDLDELLNV